MGRPGWDRRCITWRGRGKPRPYVHRVDEPVAAAGQSLDVTGIVGRVAQRLALGDSAEEPQYVETVARRGYRLMVPVEWVACQPANRCKTGACPGRRAG